MDPFRKVFVSVDFSPTSDEAVRQAHDRAVSTGAELAVCHIVPDELRTNLLFPHMSRAAAMAVPVETERAAKATLNRVAQLTGRSGEDVTIIVEHGTPYVEILRAAETWDADFMVIGSHGMTSAAGVLLGSVTHRIIRYAHCTVLVVRPFQGGGGIVVGTDFSDPDLPAVSAAADEARRTKRSLTVVHSLDLAFATPSDGAMAFGGPPPILSSEDYDALKRDAQQRLQGALKKFNVDGEVLVTSGPAGPALVATAANLKADLLVVGTLGLTGFRRILLGSVAETVAAQAPCSVLITRLHRSA